MLVAEVRFEKTNKLKTKRNLVFSTKDELDSLELAQLEGSPGYLIFNEDKIKKAVEIALADKTIGYISKGESRAKDFKQVLFRIAVKSKIDTEDFYNQEMERITKHYEEKYL